MRKWYENWKPFFLIIIRYIHRKKMSAKSYDFQILWNWFPYPLSHINTHTHTHTHIYTYTWHTDSQAWLICLGIFLRAVGWSCIYVWLITWGMVNVMQRPHHYTSWSQIHKHGHTYMLHKTCIYIYMNYFIASLYIWYYLKIIFVIVTHVNFTFFYDNIFDVWAYLSHDTCLGWLYLHACR